MPVSMKTMNIQTKSGVNQKHCHRSCSTGFTLIEVLITVSIIALMISITATSGTSSRRQFLLTSSQEQLRSLITRAKALTISTLLNRNSRICGYGIHIDRVNKKVFLFRDFPPLGGNCPGDDRYSSGEEMRGALNEFTLDRALSFGGDIDDILFIPPDPTTVINGDRNVDERTVIITAGTNENRKIKVNKAGLIDLLVGNR